VELPSDEAFVQRVLSDVRSFETRRFGRRSLRRPMVFGITAVVLATTGAVAAVVGHNPEPPRQQQPAPSKGTATVHVATARPATPSAARSVASDKTKPSTDAKPASRGFLSDHTSYALDEKTGLRLETETYTNEFAIGKTHRVTLTLDNTGRDAIAFSAPKDCALQLMAFPAGGAGAQNGSPTDPTARFTWVCAGSDADPRADALKDKFVLQPGDRKTADAFIDLKEAGEWTIVGMCRCSYSRIAPTATPAKSDPLSDLLGDALPSPLLPERSDGKNLTTPPIRVRAE
jgi:hypothetical protein